VTEPLLVSVRDAARHLGIGRDTAYQLVREGRLRSVHVAGRRVLIPRSELEDFVRREVLPVDVNGAGNGSRPPTGDRSRA
jgi:excisionase family DNA binding protein